MADADNRHAGTGGVVDIVFLIDCTGSMSPCISALKDNVRAFIDTLTTRDANNSCPVRDWRAKVVGYRDLIADGPGRWLSDHQFVRDAGALKDQLATLDAEGGGDEPESLLDALFVVASMEQGDRAAQSPDPSKWRHRRDAARVVVVFTDASFHTTMSVEGAAGGKANDLGQLIAEQRIFLSLFAPDMPCYADLAAVDRSEYEAIAFDKSRSDGPQVALKEYTSNRDNFSRVLKQLAASVSKSAAVPPI